MVPFAGFEMPVQYPSGITALIIFATDNLIISHLFGASEVAPYQISFRYVGIAALIFAVALAPLWTAITYAWSRGDVDWIRRAVGRSIRLWLALLVLVIGLVAASDFVYGFWLGDRVLIPLSLTALMGCYHAMQMFGSIFVYFVNGVGKLSVQLYHGIVFATLNIPLSVYLAKYLEFGVAGVILATCVGQLAVMIWGPLQYRKLIGGTASGVWNR